MKNDEYSIEFIGDIVEHEDGSATFQVEMSEELMATYLRMGLELMIPDEFKDKVSVQKPSFSIEKELRTVELTEEEANYLVNLGVNDVLRKHIASQTKKETK